MTVDEITGYVQESINDYKQGLGWFHSKCPEIVDSYEKFTSVCFVDGAISAKNKQLTALAISIHAQDEYCIMYHATRALECGATEQELCETIGVCSAFGGGASMSQGVTLVQDVILEHQTVQ